MLVHYDDEFMEGHIASLQYDYNVEQPIGDVGWYWGREGLGHSLALRSAADASAASRL